MAQASTGAGVQGKIVQCIGAVVDVEFPRDHMPKIYDALKLEGTALTLEVQQQLGDGIVRTIALGSSDGLRRGLMVVNTGASITVPVGKGTLGRIMDVLGNPIDERGPVDQTLTASIHRKAPAYDELPDDAFPVYLWKRASWQMHPCQKCSSFLSKPPANQKRQTLTISLSEVFISSVFPYVSSNNSDPNSLTQKT